MLDVIHRMTFPSGTKFILTGHSMGGALAQLLALQLYFHDNSFWRKDNWIVSFGSPRIGDRQFAKVFEQQIPPRRNIRFVYRADAMPAFPLLSEGYRHAG